jgi:hypothetical protein
VVDLFVVQRFVRHAKITTTARYDRRGEHAKRRAAKSLHVPFRGSRGNVLTGTMVRCT